MARKKKSVALFELIGGQADPKALDIPSWARQGPAAAGRHGRARKAVRLKQPPGFVASAGAEPALETPAPEARERIALFRVADGRLHLNLGYVSCRVICLGLIVLMVGFYKLGQSGRPAPAATPTEASAGSALPGAVGAAAPSTAYNHTEAQKEAWERIRAGGDLVVQAAVQNLTDARAIQQYLRTRGYVPYVNEDETGDIYVLDSFNLSDTDPRAGANTPRIERFGREASWQHRLKYTFKQGEGEPATVRYAPQ